MNAFFEHHKDSIRLFYRCFDRLLLNGLIQPFQQPERVIGFFNTYRDGKRVTREELVDIADQYKNWVTNRSQKWGAPILEPPEGRRDDFIDPYFKHAKPDQIVAILKARAPGRISTHRLAIRMREEKIDFEQCSNAFLRCGNPKRLQELADSLTAKDLLTCGQKWLAYFTPYFSEAERKNHGCQHRLFFSQVEYCDNLVFHKRAALDAMGERLLDANRTIGQPNKISTIFGRKVTKNYRGEIKTVIEDLDLPNPVIRSHYGNGFIKQYVPDHVDLRTEPASNNVADYGVKLRADGDGKRQAHPRVEDRPPTPIGVMHALVRFANIAAGSQFYTRNLHDHVAEALGVTTGQYTLGSLRYDLSKLRAKGIVKKVERSRKYRLTREGYSICDDLNWTGSTNVWQTTSTNSSPKSGSKLPPEFTEREQNSRYRSHNGLRNNRQNGVRRQSPCQP